MKESTMSMVRGAGLFFGGAAYGFVHAPVELVKEIKNRVNKKKERKNSEPFEVHEIDIKDLPRDSKIVRWALENGFVTEEELN